MAFCHDSRKLENVIKKFSSTAGVFLLGKNLKYETWWSRETGAWRLHLSLDIWGRGRGDKISHQFKSALVIIIVKKYLSFYYYCVMDAAVAFMISILLFPLDTSFSHFILWTLPVAPCQESKRHDWIIPYNVGVDLIKAGTSLWWLGVCHHQWQCTIKRLHSLCKFKPSCIPVSPF